MASRDISIKAYWSVFDAYNQTPIDISETEAIATVEQLLKSAFEYRMVADVPVGMFLSGGYDSSLVAAMLQSDRTEPLYTFTIGFLEPKYDESKYAKEVAAHLGTNHTSYICTPQDALRIIPLLPEIYDEPFGDSSAIPTVLVSELARKSVTISLSADGGDEIFGGYNRYYIAWRKFNRLPPFSKGFAKSLLDFSFSAYTSVAHIDDKTTKYYKAFHALLAQDMVKGFQVRSQHFTDLDIKRLLKNKYSKSKTNFEAVGLNKNMDGMNSIMAVDYCTYMADDILVKVDRATMSVGLEGREPFLDHRIIEFVARLPSSLKIKNGVNKYLLKQIAHQYLPKQIMDRPKKGFSVPIFDALKGYFIQYLSKSRLEKEGFFNAEQVIGLRDAYLQGKPVNVQRLWFILMFEMWYERWMEKGFHNKAQTGSI